MRVAANAARHTARTSERRIAIGLSPGRVVIGATLPDWSGPRVYLSMVRHEPSLAWRAGTSLVEVTQKSHSLAHRLILRWRTEVVTMWTRRTFLEALSTWSLATQRVALPRPPLLNRRDAAQQSLGSSRAEMLREGELVIERPLAGRPHEGKVLAAIQPHSDELPLFAAGTVAKLVSEG